MSRSLIGIDIGGTKILGLRLGPGRDAEWAVEAECKVATPLDAPSARQRLRQVVDTLGDGGPAPGPVGLGAPGLVDVEGVFRASAHLPGLVGLPLAAELRGLGASAVWVGNDATAAGWGERVAGAAMGCDDVLMITLGTGIGGAIISSGHLVEGAHRFSGEFGHMIVDPHGPPCPCGQRGCWERFASGSGLGQLAREEAIAGRAPSLVALAGGDPEAVRSEHVTEGAALGDPAAIEILARMAWWLGLGLANLANAFDPEVIVVGGGLIEAGEALLEPTRLAFADLVEAPLERGRVPIRAARLGPQAGAIGAALLAARRAGNDAGGPGAVG